MNNAKTLVEFLLAFFSILSLVASVAFWLATYRANNQLAHIRLKIQEEYSNFKREMQIAHADFEREMKNIQTQFERELERDQASFGAKIQKQIDANRAKIGVVQVRSDNVEEFLGQKMGFRKRKSLPDDAISDTDFS